MFETPAASASFARRMPASTAFSVGAHAVLVALVLVLGAVKAKIDLQKEVQVSFIGPGRGNSPPPPPPPPPAKKRSMPKRVAKVEVPKVVEVPRDPPKLGEAPKVEEEPDAASDDGEEGGVQGGVAGGVKAGVVGGVVGGAVGGTGGGGTAPPPKPERPKARNVPAFVVQRSAIRQPQPRLSEVFKQANRGKTGIAGLYKVCVDLDGKVFEVIAVKSVPGADESIVDGIKDYWLFQPQQVPVCFLYNMPITIH